MTERRCSQVEGREEEGGRKKKEKKRAKRSEGGGGKFVMGKAERESCVGVFVAKTRELCGRAIFRDMAQETVQSMMCIDLRDHLRTAIRSFGDE